MILISNKDDSKVQFNSNVIRMGGSLYISIPPELQTHLSIEEGSTVEMQAEKGQYGKYISTWNTDQPDGD